MKKWIHSSEGVKFATSVPVLVIGGGACGLAAALAVRDGGEEVLVLEQDSQPRGSTYMSQGSICAAGTQEQRQHGVEDGPEQFYRDIVAKVDGRTDLGLAKAISQEAGPTLDWLTQRHDVVMRFDRSWRPAYGHTRARMHAPPRRCGEDLLNMLLGAAERADVNILTSARVTELYASDDGNIAGASIERPDGERESVGCKALVLACCGFGANTEMIAQFIPEMRGAPYFGWEGNRGDAINWGIALGAAVGDMNAYQGLGLLAEQYGILVNPNILIEGGVQVNAAGRRFSHELRDVSGQAALVLAQPGGVAWVIFDERIHGLCEDLPEYSQLLALGAVRTAESIDALAAQTQLPADGLALTLKEIARYAIAAGSDPFGRSFDAHSPQAPYRAIRVTGALFHTQGGLQVDDSGRVRRVDGARLPNLFAGGGAARSISGPGASGYLPGAGLCMAVTLGRLAGVASAGLARQTGGAS